MNSEEEAYICLLLADSNLPTGSFVASSGLESYFNHGFTSTTDFIQASLSTYARSSLPFVSDAHRTMERYHTDGTGDVFSVIQKLDELYDAMTLNHVAKRASKSQGVALLTLFTKGFSPPPPPVSTVRSESDPRKARIGTFIERFKMLIRSERSHGHMPVCWGILTAAIGLSLERAQFLHLFLHARNLLSSSVRLNAIGPYAAQQLLLHTIRPFIDHEKTRCQSLTTGLLTPQGETFDEFTQGPATTWPLGEILATRHDLQHTRIFNS